MSFFRSEPMTLCNILLHQESAFDCLVQLGNIGKVQFNNIYDADHVANLGYTNEVLRCTEMLAIANRIQGLADEYGIVTVFYPDVDEDEIPQKDDLKAIEIELQKTEKDLNDVSANWDGLRKRRVHLLEKIEVLRLINIFMTGNRNTEAIMAWSDSIIIHLMHNEQKEYNPHEQQQLHLGFFSGTVLIERYAAFEQMMFRVCNGNFYLKRAEIPELLEDWQQNKKVMVRKVAFMVFFVGDEMRSKVTKVCQGFHTLLYEIPESLNERHDLRLETQTDLEDLKLILDRTDEQRRRILLIATADLFIWRVKAKKMLQVYATLNRMDTVSELNHQKYLQAECWIPSHDIAKVRKALSAGTKRSSKGDSSMMFPPIITEKDNKKQPKEPPTYFHVNKFTKGFQVLIDSYGIAAYRELNPAPYTIVTFPFLFAVMFGDIGHGVIMSIFGYYLVWNEKKIENKLRYDRNPNEIWMLMFGGRYIILLMGLFSIYTGLIYNDLFSKSLNIMGSSWRVNYDKTTVSTNHHLVLNPSQSQFFSGVPYALGLDPVWDASGESAILFYNSFKMKLAIILGVAQMIFGYCLSAANFLHFKSGVDLMYVFLPQMVFLLCLFFYLVFMVIWKWLMYGGHNETPYNSACAPSILITFIDMILMKDSGNTPKGCESVMFEGQKSIQFALVMIAFASVPLLLAGKPLYIMRQKRKIRKIKDEALKEAVQRNTLSSFRKSLVYNLESESTYGAASQEDVQMSEVWIHQGIHCIESVLGSVSHTASYLRLWALSLAHDQLSTVLWDMVLSQGLTSGRGYLDGVVLYFAFWAWSILTLAILVLMEGLSAFLHCLRLHWVEFQSKFYAGSGEAFTPFKFEKSTISS